VADFIVFPRGTYLFQRFNYLIIRRLATCENQFAIFQACPAHFSNRAHLKAGQVTF